MNFEDRLLANLEKVWGPLPPSQVEEASGNAAGMTARHKAIRAALAAATPGPWHAWDRGIGHEVHVGPDCAVEPARCYELNGQFRETFAGADARLIANAPTWLAELLAEVEAADQAVQRVRDLAATLDREGRSMITLGGPYAKALGTYACDTAARIALILDGGE